MTGHLEITSLIIKLAALCNLNCRYCYVYNHLDDTYKRRPKFMEFSVFDRLMAAARRYCQLQGRGMALSFHGGEPTLMAADDFDSFVRRGRELMGDYITSISLQTNGTLLTDRWIEVLRRNRIRIGVSLDGPKPAHDMHRIDHVGYGSHDRVVDGLRRLQAAGLSPGILCVANLSSSGIETYRYFRGLGVKYIAFLIPDACHDTKSALFEASGTQTPLADYLLPVFDEWFDEDDPEIRVRPFWGLIRLMLGGDGETDVFGNPPMSYLIVETDGSIEALDALRVCGNGLNVTGFNIMNDELDTVITQSPFLRQCLSGEVPLAAVCMACRERAVCGGGYLPHRYSAAAGFQNPSIWCADLLRLISHIRHRTNISVANANSRAL